MISVIGPSELRTELLNAIEKYAMAYADWQVAGVTDRYDGEFNRMLQARDELHKELAKLEKT